MASNETTSLTILESLAVGEFCDERNSSERRHFLTPQGSFHERNDKGKRIVPDLVSNEDRLREAIKINRKFLEENPDVARFPRVASLALSECERLWRMMSQLQYELSLPSYEVWMARVHGSDGE